MKKIFLIIVLAVIVGLGTFCGCARKTNDLTNQPTTFLGEETNNEEETKFEENDIIEIVFSKDSTELIFTKTPEEVISRRDAYKNVGMDCVNMTLTTEGGLRLELTSKQIEEWKEHDKNLLNKILSGTESKEFANVEISDDYSKMEYYGIENGFDMVMMFPVISLLRVLEVRDGINWEVEVTFRNFNTHNLVWHGFIRGNGDNEGFDLNDSDWDV